jgi:hypothetical protein
MPEVYKNTWKQIITSGSNAELKGLYVKNNSQFKGDLIVNNLSETSETNNKVVVFDTDTKKFHYTGSLPVGVSSDPVSAFPFSGSAKITGSLLISGGTNPITIEAPSNTIGLHGTASHATHSITSSYTETTSTASFSTNAHNTYVANEESATNNHYFLMVDGGPKYTSASYSTKLYVNPNTGNITGTSSYADSSSFSLTSSFCTETASYADSSSHAITASFALNIPDGLGGGGGLWYDGATYWSSSLQGNGDVTKIGIGREPINYSLEVNGTMAATADVIAFMSSDKRLKDNIKPIEDPIGKIKQIGGYSFDWNDKQNIYKGSDFGVIAQEIEKVLPSLVQDREDGYKGVKYDKIVSLLIEAVKDQQSQIDELKNKINNGS